ncbi:hypothetical protein [Pseudomonas vancouverensis]|nr:hypothetical protein [Pseudomonas vancouverensis]
MKSLVQPLIALLMLWSGTAGAMACAVPISLPGGRVGSSVYEAKVLNDGKALVSTTDGLYLFDSKSQNMKLLADGKFGNVREFYPASKGGVFIALKNEAWLFDESEEKLVKLSGLPAARLSDVYSRSDGGWFITADEGLFSLSGNSALIKPVKGVKFPKVREIEIFDTAEHGWLINTSKGLFRVNPVDLTIRLVSDALPETKLSLQARKTGGWLVATGVGIFSIDPSGSEVRQLDGMPAGEIFHISRRPGAADLIFSESGVYSLDPSSEIITKVSAPEMGGIAAAEEVSDGVLAAGEKALFHVSARTDQPPAINKVIDEAVVEFYVAGDEVFALTPGAVFKVNTQQKTANKVFGDDPETLNSYYFFKLPDGSWAMGRNDKFFVFDNKTQSFQRVNGSAPEYVLDAVKGRDGGWVIKGGDGLYKLNASATQVAKVNFEVGEEVDDIFPLPGGRWVMTIKGVDGLYVSNSEFTEIVKLSTPAFGTAYTLFPRDDHGWFINTQDGLFAADPEFEHINPVKGSVAELVDTINSRKGGGWAYSTSSGVFYIDPTASKQETVPGLVDSEFSLNAQSFPDKTTLMYRDNALYLGIPDFAEAKVSMASQASLMGGSEKPEIITDWVVTHPCASVAEALRLELVARYLADDSAKDVRTRALLSKVSSGEIGFSARFDGLKQGDWSIQLVSTAGDSDELIGVPVVVSVNYSYLDLARKFWPQIAGVSAALYLAVFLMLLVFARWSSTAARVISDPVWSKVGAWPYFALRHSRLMQVWILESWFKERRATIQQKVAFLDPPISCGEVTGPAMKLLERLKAMPRIWMVGNAGMGKSSVFSAWERDFFLEGSPSLSQAVRRFGFGFVLVTLPARQYSAVSAPVGHRPESWVVEIIRRRLEQFGFPLSQELTESLLRRGTLALAIDGANEVDQDKALAAFAHQYPRVRLLVTSQALPENESEWEIWRLPASITHMREGLLELWLGEDRARTLSKKIDDSGLADAINSGYDLRLLVDVSGSEVDRAVLPKDRVGLYRAMLTRVTSADGRPLQLENLKQLAWQLLCSRRRHIDASGIDSLGSEDFKSLSRDGVKIIRKVGSSYEFRHDQMRAFLAALWLADEMPSMVSLKNAVLEGKAFDLNREDQGALWAFLILLLEQRQRDELWLFANLEPDSRGVLLKALNEEAKREGHTMVLSFTGPLATR